MAQLGAVGLCMLWSSALGEEEGEIEQDDVTWTTALALIGFLVISTGVVYLVHCHDEDIRRASWDLVNTTISIFCASSFDFGLTRVLTTIILKIQTYLKGDKLDLIQVEEKREEVLHMWWVILIVAVLAMSFFSWLHRSLLTEENHRTLFAGGNLGGHVCAFAGIIVFGHIQKYNPCWEWLVAVAFLAFTLLVLLYGGVLSFAKRHCPEKWKQKQQIHVLKEMQGEASAIVIGFLLVQTICFVGSTDTREEKKFMPILAGHPVKSDWRLVVCLAVLALLLLGFSACWSIKCQKKCRKGTVCFSFFLEFVGKLASLTGCWCLQRGGLIGFYYICKVRKDYWNTRNTNKAQYARAIEQLPFNDPQATNRATLLNALVMSVVAVVLMVVMDIIADRLQGKPCCHDGDWEMMEMQDAERDASTSQVQRSDSTASAASGLFDLHADFPKVLRAAIAGFGFLVGICWDKAFETAYDMILTTKSATLASVGEEHKRKFRLSAILDDWVRKNPHFFSLLLGLVGILISVFVGRAWYRFIVQNAMKEEGQHIDEIEAEDRAYNLVKLPSDKMPSEVDDTSSSLDETESH